MPISKQIIASGGDGFSFSDSSLFDLYVLAQSNVKIPKVCFLGTASGDNAGLEKYFIKCFERFPCEPSSLSLFSPHTRDIKGFLLDQDIIYVGGGNTKSLLGLWKEWGVDLAVKEAYEKGTILAGMSAGSVVWFDECITDSLPGGYTVLKCLGLLPGSNCPHYSEQEGRIDAYEDHILNKLVKPGYAADNGVAFHFKDNELFRTISTKKFANGFHVYLDNDELVSDRIRPDFLGEEDNFNNLIMNSICFEDIVLDEA